MIVPMKKLSLVVLESERKQALKSLRKLGVVHVEEVQGAGEDLACVKGKSQKVQLAYSLLSEIKTDKKKLAAENSLSKEDAFSLAEKVISLTEEKKNCFSQITADTNELLRFEKWGEVNPDDFSYLAEKGIYISMYEIPADKYGKIGENIETVLVNSDKNQARFILVSGEALEKGERPENLPPEAFEVVMPRVSTEKLSESIEANRKRITEIDSEIKESAKFLPALKAASEEFSKDIEFENLYSGMGVEEEEKPARLSWLTGFVPAENLPEVLEASKSQCWAVAYSDPTSEDNVPTKLKNNRLVSLIYPVTDFLGTVPGYDEYDISNWFLLFFAVFFGMIFGDGGYGAIIVLAGIASMIPSIKKKTSVSPFSWLLVLIGGMTVLWGVVTCTWFGLTPEQLPSVLKNISVPCLSNVTGSSPELMNLTSPVPFLTNSEWVKENLQIFCFTLALIQLSIAHFKGIAKNIKSLKVLGDFGSLFQLWGLFYVVLSMVVDGRRFPLGETEETYYLFQTVPLPMFCIGLVLFGFVLSFIFSNYEGNIGASILESCKNIVSVLLGVVNVFSDVVSYIRLWAVALAGGAISATVNEMAGPLFGHAIMFVFAILLLLFGHGLNMILNVLSVIVHGVRLNTLEFSTHLGMSWTGFKYSPFKE